jgi:hypothetical protein
MQRWTLPDHTLDSTALVHDAHMRLVGPSVLSKLRGSRQAVPPAIATCRTPPWLASGWGCRVGIFPCGKEVLVGGFGCGGVALQGLAATQPQVGESRLVVGEPVKTYNNELPNEGTMPLLSRRVASLHFSNAFCAWKRNGILSHDGDPRLTAWSQANTN